MTPYKAALYSAKVASFAEYAKGGSRYDAALHDAYSALAFDVGEPGALDRMPDSQMQLAAKSVHFLMDLKSDYFAVVSGAAAVWSPDTQSYIEQDYLHAVDAARCFVDVGQRTGEAVPVNWSRVRERAKASCPGVLSGLRILCFEEAHALAIDKMKEEIRAADLDLKPYGATRKPSDKEQIGDGQNGNALTLKDLTPCPPVLPELLNKPVVETDATEVTPEGKTILR